MSSHRRFIAIVYMQCILLCTISYYQLNCVEAQQVTAGSASSVTTSTITNYQVAIGQQTTANINKNNDEDAGFFYLESMDDLEHVAYLSMRNFNMTDESLLQSSWLMGLGNALHQHQKALPIANVNGDDDLKGRLALMLESFIAHLRNGHLRRLSLDELETIVVNLNRTHQAESVEYAESSTQPITSVNENETISHGKTAINPNNNNNHSQQHSQQHHVMQGGNDEENIRKSPSDRCKHLVTIYKFELRARQRNMLIMQQQQSRIEYESPSTPAEVAMPAEGLSDDVDENRLVQLCHMAVNCQSADELVNLIGGRWEQRRTLSSNLADAPASHKQQQQQQQLKPVDSGRPTTTTKRSVTQEDEKLDLRPKNLRDSLSLSIAKLCPLILFQLHDDDGLCTVRRDDRPPMITVWGFATLFVTIVSFCSLIGLSITPLLGPTGTEPSISETSESGALGPTRLAAPIDTTVQQHRRHQHRACLNLFEGLAVGSLVGSALFSLIPQAFELQERESNQGFLLKALIIFFGIYLFFLSERIMRIILDTRQQRKKKKQLNHRSSNSIQLASTTADPFEHHHHHHPAHSNLYSDLQSGKHHRASSLHHIHQPTHYRASTAYQQTFVGRKNHQPAESNFNSRLQSREIGTKRQKKQQQQTDNQHIKINAETGKQVNTSSPLVTSYRSEANDKATQLQQAKAVNFTRKRHHQSNASKANTTKLVDESQIKSMPLSTGNGSDGHREMLQPMEVARQAASLSAKSRSTAAGVRNRARRRKARHQLLAAKRQRRKRHHLIQQLPQKNTESDDQFYERSAAVNHQHSSASSSSISRGSSIAARRATDDASRFTAGNLNSLDDSLAEESCAYMSASNDDLFNTDFSDDDEFQQMRAVSQQMSRYTSNNPYNNQHLYRQLLLQQHQRENNLQQGDQQQSPRTSFRFVDGLQDQHQRQVIGNGAETPGNKQDISTVAWMIVLGDGLHNFIDGISIGAAFSESILSGVSISVAVICEEFPHELGDFAVLVSSGMTVRQALGYNFLSACTCYFGMAVGIILGDVNDGASYISALAAGVFLYIALVDMMGELSATLEDTSRESITKTLKLLLLQNVGIFIGISIIFILSFMDF